MADKTATLKLPDGKTLEFPVLHGTTGPRVIDIRKPAVRVRYDLEVLPESPQLTDVLKPVLG